jgi:aryl-alcohol dehydrogenase-like predicted oxidoreductase
MDYVDLLWVHAWDSMTPVDEIMRGLDDLVRSGKVLYVGISDTPAWVVSQANTMADLRGWSPFVALQIEYSLIQRTPERDLLPMARALDLAVTPWGILGSGVLTGKYNREQPPEEGRAREGRGRDPELLEVGAQVISVADEVGCTPSQVAVAWLRQQPGVLVPLLGARTKDQLLDNLGALEVNLSPDQMERLDQATAVEMGFPHEFLQREHIRTLTHAGMWEQIDNHRAG